ncbi:MAG TPA: RraA family protein [Candidatus Dormibacteraeota bacterium]|nr:RraA family protein [Candidatus Dormibacteraeota bacterium]
MSKEVQVENERQNVGMRVIRRIERPPAEVVAGFQDVDSTFVTDAMHRFYGMHGNIRPAAPGMSCCGPAVTVRVAPGDNLMVYAAFEVAQPGDVLVIESRGFTSVAQWGDQTSLAARKLGLAGVVMDGSIRDLDGIVEVGFPVFSQPVVVPNGALKDGPGEVNVPVAVGGVPVLPGDIVVATSSGVAVVPRDDAAAILTRARALVDAEPGKMARIEAGRTVPDELEGWLRSKGVEMVG